MTNSSIGCCLLLAAVIIYAGDRAGQSLYAGTAKLQARMAGAEDDLDQEAARCINCHGGDGKGIAEGELRGSDIRQAVITRAAERRGGPASRYDQTSFCAALRLGRDPAGVVLARGMPRYRISTEDCGALWSFLGSLRQRLE